MENTKLLTESDLAKPLVSIILPVYNGEKLIQTCLESLSKQKFFCFELLLLDDCSQDNTKVTLANYLNKEKNFPIRFIQSKRQRGFYRSLKILLKLSRGYYYLVIGHDDFLDDNYFHQLCLSDGFKSRPAIVAGEIIGITVENKKQISTFHLNGGFYNQRYFFTNFFKMNLGSLYCSLLRSDIFGLESYREIEKKTSKTHPHYALLKMGFMNDYRMIVHVLSVEKNAKIFSIPEAKYYKGIKEMSLDLNTHDGRLLNPVNYSIAVFFGLYPLLKSRYYKFRWFSVLYLNIVRSGIGHFIRNPSILNMKLLVRAIFIIRLKNLSD